MAKRIKLEKALLTSEPEVKKLQGLDQDMTSVLKSKDVPLDSKLQRYEELLAEYKQVLDKYARFKSKDLDIDMEDLKESIHAILQRQGVTFRDDRVYFPVDKATRKRWRKPVAIYSIKSLRNAVNFLTARQSEAPSANTKRMAEKVYNYLKNEVTFNRFPNFQSLNVEQAVRFNGRWNRL